MDLKQIDLGNFSGDPDKYIDVFQGLTQTFNMSWKDVMLLLDQTLTGSEKQTALEAAQQFGDEFYMTNACGPDSQERSEHFPTG